MDVVCLQNRNRPRLLPARESTATESSNDFTTATENSWPTLDLETVKKCPVHGSFYRKLYANGKPSAAQLQDGIFTKQGPIPKRRAPKPDASQCSTNGADRMAWIRATIDHAREDYWKSQILRKRLRAAIPVEELERRETEKWTVMRNLITISVAFLFICSAYIGLQNLQTSINGDENLGFISLCCVYMGTIVSCLFTPGYLLNRIGCKMTMIVSLFIYSLYMLINFRTTWYSLLPGSLAMGFASAPLWAAKSAYLTETGIHYAELNFESPNIVMVRFFGIFYLVVHTGQVFGNLISSWILKASESDNPLPPRLDAVDHTCGQYFTNVFHLSPTAARNLRRPPITVIRSLCGVYFCCILVALMVLSLFLNQLRKDMSNTRVWKTTIKQLQKPKTLLLIPLSIFSGMERGFISGYVGCCLGISNIGSVLTCFGVCNAICSVLFGPLIQLFGRMPLFMFGAVVDMLMIFTLLIWPPNPEDTILFYVVAATWGMADGVWNTQIHSMGFVGLNDPQISVAAANFRLWDSVGFLIALIYHAIFPMTVKLYILLAFLLFGMLGYILLESWEHIAVIFLLNSRYM
ncbi:Potassium channel regulatory protein unc 93 [Trichuris trichiura]|uniref:Potassium channel regulatory protein unc 93 n=1 Tax=Trichuris trichiura TaxID=36087 RepID=A0A077Z0X5_TRITR|nr:Potassium channel regulatory protein unc 93 [Trichuris trichiura]